jgi:hypothetical protein
VTSADCFVRCNTRQAVLRAHCTSNRTGDAQCLTFRARRQLRKTGARNGDDSTRSRSVVSRGWVLKDRI